MRAYKFLDADGNGPFTGVRWALGGWVETSTVTLCREGVHGCTAGDLSHWLAASLWEVELDGEVIGSRHKVAGSRGRLVRRIDDYDTAVRELGEVGAWRSRDRAVAALAGGGADDLAHRFVSTSTLTALVALEEAVDDTTFAGTAAALAVDAASFALDGNPAQSPFVAACSAGHVTAGPHGDQGAYDDGYAAERTFQSAWLTDRLSLV